MEHHRASRQESSSSSELEEETAHAIQTDTTPLEDGFPPPPPPPSNHKHVPETEPWQSVLRKVGAEFLGTFLIVFGGLAGSIISKRYEGIDSLLGPATTAGLAVMLAVQTTGHISKAHLNPAVTIAFATIHRFPMYQVLPYLFAEMTGSLSASLLIKAAYQPPSDAIVTVPSVSLWQSFILEFVATFVLMFVISAVATDPKAVGLLASLAIGGAVVFGILMAGPATGASMNPARTLGPAIVTGIYTHIWIYMVAPVAGALSGAAVYRLIQLKDQDQRTSNRELLSVATD